MTHTSTEQPGLLPCPFCGSKAEVFQTGARTSGHGESSDYVGIRCTGCGLSIQESDYAGCDVKGRAARCANKWNRRTTALAAAPQPPETEKCATCQSLEAEGVNIKQCAVPAPLQLPKPWGYAVEGRIFIGNLPEHIKRAVATEDMKVQNLYTERQLLTAQRDRWHQPKNEQPQPR